MWVGVNAFEITTDNPVKRARIFPADYGIVRFRDRCVVGAFLRPNSRLTVEIVSGERLEQIQIETKPCPLVRCQPQLLVTKDTPDSVLEIMMEKASSDYLFTEDRSVSFWARLFRLGLFALDDDIVVIPNPRKRFCFDLESNVDWKVDRKYMSDFELVVESKEIGKYLCMCREMHESTWISDKFIANITEMVERVSDLEFIVFIFIEKKTGKIASISAGYRFGTSFMDFTACTPMRDKRSCGKLLIVAVAEYLGSQRGVKLWYLGFKLPYMESLANNFQILNRSSFKLRW